MSNDRYLLSLIATGIDSFTCSQGHKGKPTRRDTRTDSVSTPNENRTRDREFRASKHYYTIVVVKICRLLLITLHPLSYEFY